MKKLLIVCEEKFKSYGDFLSQLISSNDDKLEKVVGVKDGEVVAQVWTEKEYNANAVQISSEQYILFIGNSKKIKEKRIHMLKKWENFGMEYYCLGKQCVLSVSDIVSVDNYSNFIDFAKENNKSIKNLVTKKEYLELDLDSSYDNNKNTTKMLKAFKTVGNALTNATIAGKNVIGGLSNSKNIERQQ